METITDGNENITDEYITDRKENVRDEKIPDENITDANKNITNEDITDGNENIADEHFTDKNITDRNENITDEHITDGNITDAYKNITEGKKDITDGNENITDEHFTNENITDKNENITDGDENFTDGNENRPITDGNKNITDENIIDGNDNIEAENITDGIENITDGKENTTYRRQKGDKTKWKTNISKDKRMHGKAYKRKLKDANGDQKTRGERELKERGCKTRCINKQYGKSCASFSEEERKEIFERFWFMEWSQKKTFITAMVERKEVNERRVPKKDSRRKCSLLYFLKSDGTRKPVCKNMFLSTLDIGEKSVYNWLEKSTFGIPNNPVRRDKVTNSADTDKVSSVRQYLTDLPKVPSHYCRSSSNKLYLEPIFDTFAHLYRTYKKYCADQGLESASKTTFLAIYQSMNLAIYKPKKDLCDICCSFATQNIDESVYNMHIANKEKARAEKENDKQLAVENPNIRVLTVELQAVLLAPCLNASAMYYKKQLVCHNYTVYDLGSRDCTCYFWHEGEGELTANSFTSCLCSYLEKLVEENPELIEIIIFSDGCTYQNRNAVLSNALLKFSIDKNVLIQQKFLEKGHTQMECDSVHSVIERKIRKKAIHSPYDYLEIIKSARMDPKPYVVEYLAHNFFNDYTKLNFYSSIRPGTKVGDPVVTNIKALNYAPDGVIQFKLSFDDDFEDLPRRSKCNGNIRDDIIKLYRQRLPISESKYKNLQELKVVMPPLCHHFYDSLLHE